jgi:hypothetical protein
MRRPDLVRIESMGYENTLPEINKKIAGATALRVLIYVVEEREFAQIAPRSSA